MMKWIEEGMGNKSYVKKTFKILKLKYFYKTFFCIYMIKQYIYSMLFIFDNSL
jgi:hypothetical protein